VAAVRIHGVDIEIAIARGGKDDLPAIASDGGFGVVSRRVGEAAQVAAVRIGGVNVVGVVDRPYIAFGIIGLGRTLCAGRMRGRKQDALAGRKEVAAGGASLAGAQAFGSCRFAIRRGYGNAVDLVTGDITSLVLVDQIMVIGGKIGLGILPAKSKLADIAQMLLTGKRKRRRRTLLLAGLSQQHQEKK